MSAKLLTFPRSEPLTEWRIEVNSREDDSVTCTHIPADRHRNGEAAYWLLWVHATALDHVPTLVEKAQQLLKHEQAIMRPSRKKVL